MKINLLLFVGKARRLEGAEAAAARLYSMYIFQFVVHASDRASTQPQPSDFRSFSSCAKAYLTWFRIPLFGGIFRSDNIASICLARPARTASCATRSRGVMSVSRGPSASTSCARPSPKGFFCRQDGHLGATRHLVFGVFCVIASQIGLREGTPDLVLAAQDGEFGGGDVRADGWGSWAAQERGGA